MKEKTELQDVLSELGKELQDTKAHVGEGKKTGRDLEAQLEVQYATSNKLAVRKRLKDLCSICMFN